MSREIKFRGRKSQSEDWVYGDLLTNNGSPIIVAQGDVKAGHHWHIETPAFIVGPETVGEYTGLKDKNGKEIYEGDVVRCGNGHVGRVLWDQEDAHFNVYDYYSSSDDYPTMAFTEGGPFEIIGNIYENPELLKKD